MNAAILHINRLQGYYDAAMVACVAALGQMIQHDVLIKADEIEFLKNLTMYFRDQQKIAPISLLRIWQLLNNFFMSQTPNTAANKAMPHVREFANTLYFDYIEFQQRLQQQLVQLPRVDQVTEMAELQIVYTEEPTLPLLDCLIQFSALAAPECPKPRLLRTERGSFHEFHEIALIAIPYIQTLLALLGVVVPIAIYKKQNQKGSATTQVPPTGASSKVEITVPSSETSQLSVLVPNTINIKSETAAILIDVMKSPCTQVLIGNVDFGGYNKENVQSVTIRIQ